MALLNPATFLHTSGGRSCVTMPPTMVFVGGMVCGQPAGRVGLVCLFVVILRHSNSISIISWHGSDMMY